MEVEDIDGHDGSEDGEEDGEGDAGAGEAARDPTSFAELTDGSGVLDRRADVDEDAEGDEGDSCERRTPCTVDGKPGFGGLHLAQEEAEAGDGESEAHEGEAGANPGEKGALGGKVDTRVLLGGAAHVRDYSWSSLWRGGCLPSSNGWAVPGVVAGHVSPAKCMGLYSRVCKRSRDRLIQIRDSKEESSMRHLSLGLLVIAIAVPVIAQQKRG